MFKIPSVSPCFYYFLVGGVGKHGVEVNVNVSYCSLSCSMKLNFTSSVLIKCSEELDVPLCQVPDSFLAA